MIKVPYEVIEFRELKALNKEYSWQSVFTYWLCMKTAATITGMALAVFLYGLDFSWPRMGFFARYEIVEALLWIPMIVVCSMIEYAKVVFRVHKRMGIIYKNKTYFRVVGDNA